MGVVSYHHGDLRRALVGIARQAVIEGGVDRLTMRWLTARAGVSVAAAYHHFADRTALLWAVAEEGFDELLIRLRRALDAAPEATGGPSRLLCLGAAYVRFACEHRPLYRLMMQACRDQAYRSHRRDGRAALCFALLRDEIRSADVACDRQDELAMALGAWAAMHGAADLEVEVPAGCAGADRAADLCRRLLPGLFEHRGKSAIPVPAAFGDNHD